MRSPFVAEFAESRASLERLELLDCNVSIGRPSGLQWVRNAAAGSDDLLSEMDRIGVASAIVYHVLAREYSPRLGNHMLLEEIQGRTRLGSAWLLLPHQTGEFLDPSTLIDEIRRSGVAMARMHPSADARAHRYLLANWVVGPLLDALEEAQLPLAIDFTLFRRGEPPWESLYQVLDLHRSLKVILMDIQGRNNRTLYPLLDKFSNLYIQSAGFNVHRGIEDFVERFGAHRMVFGSGYPIGSMGAARFHLETADIADEDKRLIGAGNLRYLIGTQPLGREGVAINE